MLGERFVATLAVGLCFGSLTACRHIGVHAEYLDVPVGELTMQDAQDFVCTHLHNKQLACDRRAQSNGRVQTYLGKVGDNAQLYVDVYMHPMKDKLALDLQPRFCVLGPEYFPSKSDATPPAYTVASESGNPYGRACSSTEPNADAKARLREFMDLLLTVPAGWSPCSKSAERPCGDGM